MNRLYVLAIVAAMICGFTTASQAQDQQPNAPAPAPAPAASAAPAAPAPVPPRQIFQKADANGDGNVTFEEVTAAFPQMTKDKFDKMDRNKDGVVTKADAPAAEAGQQLRQTLQKADADKDGKVTLEEAQKAMPKMTPDRFSKLDRNHDGALSSADMPAGGAQGPKMNHEEKRAALRNRIVRCDTNGDGKVSLEEFMAQPNATAEMFKRMDRNNDGSISEDDADVSAMPPIAQQAAPQAAPQARPQTFDPTALDTNKDEKVSYEEATAFWSAFSREAFDRLDANKDGFITMDEVTKTGA